MLSDDQFMAASIGDIDWLKESISKQKIKYDENGLTVLHLAAEHGHLDCMKLLIEEYGFDVDLTTNNGSTSLQLTINKENEKRSFDCVSYLLDKGANLSLYDEEGTTALHRAASQGRLSILQLLLDCGAKVDCEDIHGQVPFDLARLWGHERCGKILKATMWHEDKEYIAIQMKKLELLKSQICRIVRANDSHKERKRETKTKIKQGVSKQHQKQSPPQNNEVLDATKFKSRIKTQSDKPLMIGKDAKKKHSRLTSKSKHTWKPFSKKRPASYIKNLKDEHPKEHHKSKHQSKTETKYIDKKHGLSPEYFKTLFAKDSQFANIQLPDLPSDIIAKALMPNFTLFERPVVFECKNILDVPAKWKPPNMPKNEVCLHLSTDTTSIIFQNSLQPKTKLLIAQSRKKNFHSEMCS